MPTAATCKSVLQRSVLFIVLFGCCQIFNPPSLCAQVVGATVSGTITDASGATSPGVTVAIKNLATQIASNSVTNADGFYIAPNLPAGEYQITFGAPGFAPQGRSGIILTVGQQLSLNLTMEVGSATEMVNVTADVPAVDLVNSTIGGVTNATAIEEISLKGRSWTGAHNLRHG